MATMDVDVSERQWQAAERAFEAALAQAVEPERAGQLDLFPDEDEEYIRRRVETLCWEPLLPNAGARERRWLKRLRPYLRDESLVVGLKLAVGRYIDAIEKCLPSQEYIRREGRSVYLPGCYYARKAVTERSNKQLHTMCLELRQGAVMAEDWERKWLADLLLGGMPAPISNFQIECLYLLVGEDGEVRRLVRLMNTKGEVNRADEIGGCVVLPNEMGSSAEKFRQWVQSVGNFTWGCEGGAGNVELQLLQRDLVEQVAYKSVNIVRYCGSYAVKGTSGTEGASAVLWFGDDCVIAPDRIEEGKVVSTPTMLQPDRDGIYWYRGEGYALSKKGRELAFAQGRPRWRPDVRVEDVEFDQTSWDPLARELARQQPLGGFFREMARRFWDSAGGMDGWLTLGSTLAYAAAPEIFAQHGAFPGLWISGQMGSGKTVYASWLLALQGLRVSAGLGLISGGVTAVYIACQFENYSNLMVWLDEFRAAEVPTEKVPFLRDSYSRQLLGKWSPDGVQRVIRTAPLVSGESTSSDAATRSRYPHVLLAEEKRTANHLEWMGEHKDFFFLVFRELLLRRREYVELVLKQITMWMDHPDLERVPTRTRLTWAVAYAGFAATTVLLESHTAQETAAFRMWLSQAAATAAADVAGDVNVNVFIQDLITAYGAGEIDNDYLRVEGTAALHPPGAPNQTDENGYGKWSSYVLYIQYDSVLAAMQGWARKNGLAMPLRSKDYRDQLKQYPFWEAPTKGGQIKKRMGPKGSMASKPVWGIRLDSHPLGYRPTPDDEVLAARAPQPVAGQIGFSEPWPDGDPRKGPLYAVVEGIIKGKQASE